MFSELFRGMIMYDDYRMYRDFRGMSDYKVAKAAGIGRSTFSDWKSGRSAPKLDKLKKIADVLEIPVEFITGEGTTADPLDTITEDEQKLLRLFRKMNDAGKATLLSLAESMTMNDAYQSGKKLSESQTA